MKPTYPKKGAGYDPSGTAPNDRCRGADGTIECFDGRLQSLFSGLWKQSILLQRVLGVLSTYMGNTYPNKVPNNL